MTATATRATDLTSDEVIELERRRRALITTVEDTHQDRSRLQAKLKALGNNLEDKGVTEQIAQLQQQLERNAAAGAKAEKALASFDRENPSAEELERRGAVLAQAKARQAREKARKPYLTNRGKAIAHLEALIKLDSEAVQMLSDAEPDLFLNGAQAIDLASLLNNWKSFNRDSVQGQTAEGLARVKAALQNI